MLGSLLILIIKPLDNGIFFIQRSLEVLRLLLELFDFRLLAQELGFFLSRFSFLLLARGLSFGFIFLSLFFFHDKVSLSLEENFNYLFKTFVVRFFIELALIVVFKNLNDLAVTRRVLVNEVLLLIIEHRTHLVHREVFGELNIGP
jgi:hypothetical protein